MPRILFLSLRAGKMSHVFLKSAQPQDSDLTSCLDAEGSGVGWGVQGPAPSASGPGGGARASREHLPQPGTGQNTHDSRSHDILGQTQGHWYKWPQAAPAAQVLSHLTGCLTPSPEPALRPRAPIRRFDHSVLPSLKRPPTTGHRGGN